MRRLCLSLLGVSLFACASSPAPYGVPRGMEAPAGEPQVSRLEGSDPPLTVECRGNILSEEGEVCTTRAGSAVVSRVRNVTLPNAAIVRRFDALVAQVSDELGAPRELTIWSATRVGDTPAYGAVGCEFEAIRTSVPSYPVAPPELAASGAPCMRAAWTTGAEEVVVAIVPAVTSALDGPAVPGPEAVGHVGLRLYRATRDRATVALYEQAKLTALQSIKFE